MESKDKEVEDRGEDIFFNRRDRRKPWMHDGNVYVSPQDEALVFCGRDAAHFYGTDGSYIILDIQNVTIYDNRA